MKKKEIIIIICALLISLVTWGGVKIYNSLNVKKDVRVVHRDVVALEFSLEKDAEYDLQGDYGNFHIEVKDGKVRAHNVECPNHDCEGFGWISHDSLLPMIICIPNNIYIEVISE